MGDFNEIPDVSMDSALFGGSNDNQSVSLTNISQRNIDMKSGNFIMRDATNERIFIGVLPDGTYGMVISKAGYNVTDLFT